MIVFPNCKINIGLNITERRPDGFHNLETVFYPVPWTDILEIIPSDTEEFIFEGTAIDCPLTDNLCYKAYRLLKQEFDLPPVKLYLYKNIPSGAGLGGGSADAAYTLMALNQMFSLGLKEIMLMCNASLVGSDCAFFIKNQAIFGSGKGNTLTDIQLDLSGYYLLIVKPPIHISSAEAFQMVSPKTPENSLKELITMPVSEWKTRIGNDFEVSVFSKYPELKTIKDKLYSLGAVYASMSGSGSAIYGLFDKKIDCQKQFPRTICWMKQL